MNGKMSHIWASQHQSLTIHYQYVWSLVFYQPYLITQRTYICTDDALNKGLCMAAELGFFIFNLPPDKPMNDTSFWSARLAFQPAESASSSSGLWNNPQGNPTPTKGEYDSPWRVARQTSGGNEPPQITVYSGPIRYEVSKTGYYCVGVYKPLVVLIYSVFNGKVKLSFL